MATYYSFVFECIVHYEAHLMDRYQCNRWLYGEVA